MQRASGVIGTVKTKATTTDPCCGCCSLQSATKAVAIINIVLSVIYLLIAIIIGLFVATVGVTAGVEIAESPGGNEAASNKATGGAIAVIATIFAIIIIVVFVATLALGILLYLGAKRKDHTKCKIWFIIHLVFSVIFIIDGISGVTSFAGFIKLILTVLIIIYQLWIVYAFMHEIDPDNLARLDEYQPGTDGFNGIPNQEIQFTKNPYEQPPPYPQQNQPDNYGWGDNQ